MKPLIKLLVKQPNSDYDDKTAISSLVNPNNPLEFVIPEQAGIQQKKCCEADKTSVLSASREEFNQLDSRLRGNDVIFDLMDNPGLILAKG